MFFPEDNSFDHIVSTAVVGRAVFLCFPGARLPSLFGALSIWYALKKRELRCGTGCTSVYATDACSHWYLQYSNDLVTNQQAVQICGVLALEE